MTGAKEDRLFCSRPFEWLELSRGTQRPAEARLCCPTWLPTPVGTVPDQPLEDIWNGQTAKDVRKSILDGSFSHCQAARCPHLQARDGPVQKASDVTETMMQKVIAENLTQLPWGPQKINCAYDRSCNLTCPSCRTKKIIETSRKNEISDIQTYLEDHVLPFANYLYITGSGDAFGSPYFNKWLRTMKLDDSALLEHIHLHTNGQLWDEKMWAKMPETVRKRIKSAEISMDAATAETYAENRRGGDFAQLEKNLDFIRSLRTNGPLTHLKISMVVQRNNFTEMSKFIEIGKRIGADVVYFSKLVNWGTFSIPELLHRSVHLPANAKHNDFLDVLNSDVFDSPIVQLGNLSDLREHAASA